MTLSSGKSLSHYEILGPLGAGGMGEVYRARDTKLGREVAIKVLSQELASDEERLVRFEREAKLLASLNHPNIGAIYGVDQVEDVCFLALELVPGEDLAQRLANGPLPVKEALDVCRQIAEGLEAAHESGVVHRDLKPANVCITPDGAVKLLDFGLAKPIQPQTSKEGRSSSPSDSFVVTSEGMILGTPTYMSPEQARGKSVDKRADIWAFGCVLYECLTGKRAFGGESMTDVLAAIVEHEPDWDALPATIPQQVRILLARCLDKDRRQRLRDIGEARVQLGAERSIAAGGDAPSTGGASRVLVAASIGFLLGATLIWAWVGRGDGVAAHSTGSSPVGLVIPATTKQYIDPVGIEMAASPDGKALVFPANGCEDGELCLWLRELASFEARRLPETENARRPFWSPDSATIGFAADGELRTLHLDEQVPRVVSRSSPGFSYRGADWSPSGVIVLPLERRPGLWRVDSSGGEPQQITALDPEFDETQHHSPHFLPDGDHFLYLAMVQEPEPTVVRHRLYVGSLASGESRFIAELPSSPMYTELGELVYLENGSVRSVPFDAEQCSITGEPRTLVDGAFYIRVLGQGSLSAARDGRLFFQQRDSSSIVWMSPRGLVLGRVLDGQVLPPARISPDGESVALVLADPQTAQTDLWIHGSDRATSRRVTDTFHAEFAPVWNPDGTSLCYTYAATRGPSLFSIATDGRSPASPIWEVEVGQAAHDVSEGLLLATAGDELWIVPLDDPEAREFLVRGQRGRFSPDGRWVAYEARPEGRTRTEIFLLDRESVEPPLQVTLEGGRAPVWSPDGSRLYFLSGENRLAEVELATQEQRTLPEPGVLFETAARIGDFDVDPDGSRFLMHLFADERPPIQVLLRGAEVD
jgi:Tol biopolymer transport system component